MRRPVKFMPDPQVTEKKCRFREKKKKTSFILNKHPDDRGGFETQACKHLRSLTRVQVFLSLFLSLRERYRRRGRERERAAFNLRGSDWKKKSAEILCDQYVQEMHTPTQCCHGGHPWASALRYTWAIPNRRAHKLKKPKHFTVTHTHTGTVEEELATAALSSWAQH